MTRVLRRMEQGHGRMEDIDLMKDVGQNMLFKSFCALADGAVSPIDSSIKFFRQEYEDHVRLGRCPLKDSGPELEAATARRGGTAGGVTEGPAQGNQGPAGGGGGGRTGPPGG